MGITKENGIHERREANSDEARQTFSEAFARKQRLLKKAAEVAYLVRAGWSQELACAECDISERVYLKHRRPSWSNEPAAFVPTPSELVSITAAIRSGEIILSEFSRKRWERFRRIDQSEDEQRDAFDLAAAIDEDAAIVPGWFRG